MPVRLESAERGLGHVLAEFHSGRSSSIESDRVIDASQWDGGTFVPRPLVTGDRRSLDLTN